SNVLYAGRMLVRLRSETGAWSEAIARYQGGSRKQQTAYLCKVWHHLSELDRTNAKLIDGSECRSIEQAEIAPETRRAFRQSQVASTN
ncbi:MAG TPA: lytic transglycosylase domain-containing protein, partial [Azospirillaceae bacterium]|nr:lytic transglycosylase domain-containing protein [Azospirillaceae bacterium]